MPPRTAPRILLYVYGSDGRSHGVFRRGEKKENAANCGRVVASLLILLGGHGDIRCWICATPTYVPLGPVYRLRSAFRSCAGTRCSRRALMRKRGGGRVCDSPNRATWKAHRKPTSFRRIHRPNLRARGDAPDASLACRS